MSVRKDSEPRERHGVLSNLPRTRPQRSSARRVAARKATTAAGTNGAAPTHANGRTRASAAATAKPRASANARASADARATAHTPPVPRQGFECESERASGPVQPPGGAELVASAAEIIGELAKAGLSTGERVLKDVLSRLPLS
jgi:hypothetical protein